MECSLTQLAWCQQAWAIGKFRRLVLALAPQATSDCATCPNYLQEDIELFTRRCAPQWPSKDEGVDKIGDNTGLNGSVDAFRLALKGCDPPYKDA